MGGLAWPTDSRAPGACWAGPQPETFADFLHQCHNLEVDTDVPATRAGLLRFIRNHPFAVQASVTASGAPQAAVVGIVATDQFVLFFDTLDVTRKAPNLRHDPRIAFVIGGLCGGEERTVQYEGIVDEPRGPELATLQALYFARFPDGLERQKLPTIVYLRVRPTWIRYSDFGRDPALIEEWTFPDPAFG